jgi:hypothetical protein
MKKIVCILAAMLVCETLANEWRPSDALLQAVREVESNNGKMLYGDSGRSLGAYQMSAAAWADVSAYRRARGLKTYSYNAHVMHSFVNRAYAADYLTMIHSELTRRLRRPPTAGEIYAVYNMGLSNFAECGYRLANVNSMTAKKVQIIHNLIGG